MCLTTTVGSPSEGDNALSTNDSVSAVNDRWNRLGDAAAGQSPPQSEQPAG